MARNMKKRFIPLVAGLLVMLLAGCSGPKEGEGSESGEAGASGPVTVRVLKTHLGKGTTPDANNAHVKYVAEKTGVSYKLETTPPGADPAQNINVLIASNDLPDIMRPVGGVEQALIQQGGALALDDLLPKYAPHVWSRIPKEAWDVVRTASPDGKIYYVPKVYLIPERVPMIRKDWMDKVNLPMPGTKEEYIALLKAFKEQDPNENGKADELPTVGRELGTWMDHTFAMYGVAMWEGKPEWDIYEGKIGYAGTTANMKAAIGFLRELYAKKLLDNETFLNKGDVWQAKINNNLVGNWYHLPASLKDKVDAMRKTAPKAYIAGLPLPKVDGFTGFVTQKSIGEAEWLIPKSAEKQAPHSLRLLDFFYDPANEEFVLFGLEGLQHEVVGGKKKLLPQTDDKPLALGMLNYTTKESMDKRIEQLYSEADARMVKDIFAVGMKDARRIAGDGMPSSVYEGYPDIQSHKLYQEYLTKIVIGEWPIDKFDEYVDKWKKSGGDAVTKRVQDWYGKVQGNNQQK
ncbi:ABC transporter substrate-binding protein [Paenibacillus sp. y28]|uniref:ABC transporter substrate-binding protein n=1 Tax=Paenibacillus sp. y28 TaxID=3129110 RepID=UPI003019F88E